MHTREPLENSLGPQVLQHEDFQHGFGMVTTGGQNVVSTAADNSGVMIFHAFPRAYISLVP